MRPRNVARPAAAGALCFAFTCAGAAGRARADRYVHDPTPTRRGAGAADRRAPSASSTCARATAPLVAGRVAPAVAGLDRLAAGQARRALEADRPRSHRCCRALQAA